jgi:ribonucleotide monophosphatase NagD (HAD superfamily)
LVTSYVPLIPKRSGSVASVSAAIAAGLAHVTGVTPVVMGKPSPLVMRLVRARLGLQPSEIVVVGDDPALEIELGRRSGALTVLVLSGITGAGDVPDLPEGRAAGCRSERRSGAFDPVHAALAVIGADRCRMSSAERLAASAICL